MSNRLSAGSLQLIVTAAFAAALTGALGIAPGVNSARCLSLSIASSHEKAAMLQQFAVDYKAANRPVEGYCVNVQVFDVNSGDAEAALEAGWPASEVDHSRPDVWSPASSAWVALLQYRVSAAGLRDSPIPAGLQVGGNSLFASPLVIGMPQPMASALGYPAKQVAWSDIFNLATNPEGWGSKGNPQWGSFKLAKTVPTVSTSGLNALIATYYASRAPMTVTAVQSDPAAEQFVSAIENSVVHYGLTVSEFTDNLHEVDRAGNPANYVSAIALEEQELVNYDKTATTLLSPVYPTEGTLLEDHPYVLLRWSAEKAAAANDFFRFVETNEVSAIDANGFRIAGAHHQSALAGGQLATKLMFDGVGPDHLVPTIDAPDGAVIAAMVARWEKFRRAARVLVLVDKRVTSGTLGPVLCGLEKAAGSFQAQDQVGVATFPDSAGAFAQVLPIGPVGASPPARTKDCGSPPASLATALSRISGEPNAAGSGLDSALSAAVAALNTSYDPRLINAVLVVELAPSIQPDAANALVVQLQAQLTPTAHGGVGGVRVFAIGPQDDQSLKRITLAGGQGALYAPNGSAHFLNEVISGF